MNKLNNIINWLMNTKLVGPVTSGDVIATASFSFMAIAITNGAQPWGLLFCAVCMYIASRIHDARAEDLNETIKLQNAAMQMATAALKEQRELLEKMDEELKRRMQEEA